MNPFAEICTKSLLSKPVCPATIFPFALKVVKITRVCDLYSQDHRSTLRLKTLFFCENSVQQISGEKETGIFVLSSCFLGYKNHLRQILSEFCGGLFLTIKIKSVQRLKGTLSDIACKSSS